MALRDLARKGLGLFVELEDEAPAGAPSPPARSAGGPGSDAAAMQQLRSRSVGDLLKELEGPEPEQIEQAVGTAVAAAPTAPTIQDGHLDFTAIYGQAQIPAQAFGAEQTLELIQSYPPDMALPVRRQALDAALKTMGRAMNITKESIVADASRKLNALAAYVEAAQRQRDAAVSAAQERFAQLQAQLQAEQAKAAAADQQFRAVVQQCEAEGQRLDQVQEFLTLDAPPAAPPPADGPRPPGVPQTAPSGR